METLLKDFYAKKGSEAFLYKKYLKKLFINKIPLKALNRRPTELVFVERSFRSNKSS